MFHIAFATSDINRAKSFYADLLGCPIGRESAQWVDFDFFGHQMSIHKVSSKVSRPRNYYNPNSHIPANHFGIVLSWKDWHEMKDKLDGLRINYLLKPQIVFPGEVGEQKTMFIQDPDGNFIEFKSFEDPEAVFRK